ncbi:hypothetical protein [Actinomadura rubrisoli]|uniref:ABC transporter permease n=1 Tax=Actinomadura rubrisoli TaxID=2530368 RepID=A0A4R4ZV30_9ACTN|nr:hypothetical protein [Actinomadura rubrisoli]TDD62236.1 hypothetical protein E1298_44845 [Actinomadura rubrisoli]
MSLWRLEWLRLWRTGRGAALAAVFVLFGLVGPLTARYLPDLIGGADDDITITMPPPEPADGVEDYLQNAQQLGLVVTVIVAASALAFDSRPALSAFYRTRVGHPRVLLLPRYLVVTAAAVASFLLGALAAWYETAVLLGGLPASRMLLGMALGSLYLCFATAVAALVAGLIRGVLATVVGTLALLLALAVLAALATASRCLGRREV